MKRIISGLFVFFSLVLLASFLPKELNAQTCGGGARGCCYQVWECNPSGCSSGDPGCICGYVPGDTCYFNDCHVSASACLATSCNINTIQTESPSCSWSPPPPPPTSTPRPGPTSTPATGTCQYHCSGNICVPGGSSPPDTCTTNCSTCSGPPPPTATPGTPPSPPGSVTGLDYSSSCVLNSGTATLSWAPTSNATSYDLRVSERDPANPGAPWIPCTSGNTFDECVHITTTSHTINVRGNRSYDWWLRACNSVGCGPYNNALGAHFPIFSAPTASSVVCHAPGTTATINWTIPSVNGMNPSSYTLRVNDTRDAWFTPGRDTFVTQGASSYLLATTPAVSYDWDASANYGSTSKSSCRGPFSRFSCSAPAPTTPPTPTPTPSCGISIPATLTMNANSSVVMNVTVTSQTGGIVDQVNFISTIPSRVSASSPNLIAPFSTTLTSNTSAGSASITAYGFMNGNTATYRCFDTSVVTVLAPIPTAVPPCQVTTSPSVLNLVDGTTGGVSAFVSSGLGSATVNRMDFGSYNTVIAAVGPSSDVTSPYNTSVFAQNPGSTAVWGTATLSDGRVCQTTAASDTNVNVTAPTPPPPGTPTPTRVPTPTTVPPCQVTTSPAVLNLVDGTTGGVSASVSSGLGSATVNRMDFGSYNTTIATVSPTFDLSGSFSTTVFAQNPGSTAVWGTATLSDGRICQTTAATDTNVTVIPPPTVAPGTPTPTRVPTPTPVLLCQVTTSPSTLNLVDGTSGGVSASVTSGLGSATVNRMDFGSYNTTIATVSPTFDTTSPTYTTTVFAQNPGSTAVWGTATLSDGRVCQSTAATDTNVNVTAPTPLPGTPTPTRTPTPLRTPTPTTIVLPTNTPTRTPTPSRTPTPTIACPPPPPAPIPDPPTYNSIHLTNVFSGDVIHRYTSNLDPNPPPSYNGDVTTNDDYDDPVACNPGTTYYYQAWRTVGACTSRSGYSGPASCLDYPDWYQTSGNVTANGAVRNEVPVTVSTFGLIIGTSVNWGGTGIQSAETIIHPSVVTNPGYSGFYNSAVNRAGSNKVNSSVSPLDIDSVSGTAVDGVVYVENNANNLTLSSTTLNKNMVLIYSGTGTVTINGDIRIGAGATTFVLLAKGDIKVSNTVGTPDASPVTDNLQGIYIAGGKFYDTDGDEAGKTLRVNGTVVGLRGVSLDRNSSTDVYPKDYFVFNPGYIMNLPLGLRVSTRFFNELAP